MARPGLFQHRKFVRLARRLGSKMMAAGALEITWQAAYQSGDPRLGTAEDVEALCDWTGAPGSLAVALVESGFLDVEPPVSVTDVGNTGVTDVGKTVRNTSVTSVTSSMLVVHDLLDHAPAYVTDRYAREAARKVPRLCACGVEFRSSDPRAVYHSIACKQAAYRMRHGLGLAPDSSRPAPLALPPVTDCYGSVTDRYATPPLNIKYSPSTKGVPITSRSLDLPEPVGDDLVLDAEVVEASDKARKNYPADFEEGFWKPYPKKSGKGAAFIEWKRLTVADRRRANEAAKLFGEICGSVTRTFILDPERWLKRRHFEDDPDVWREKAAKDSRERSAESRPVATAPARAPQPADDDSRRKSEAVRRQFPVDAPRGGTRP